MATQPTSMPTNKVITLSVGIISGAVVSLWNSYVAPISEGLGTEQVLMLVAALPGALIAWFQEDAPNNR